MHFSPLKKRSPPCRRSGELPAGRCVCTYHVGDYLSIGKAYERILDYCAKNDLHIQSDSYEFALNDYLSTGDEREYITRVFFYVQ